MSDIYFKASLQNTLNPEVGTFDNVDNKEGTFTLEDGEYYLTNNTNTSYRVYYPTKNINSVGFTIEFDINYSSRSGFSWCLLFNGNDSTYWFGVGIYGESLEFRGQTLPNYHLISSPNTWLHVKCIFDYDNSQNNVHIYVNNSEVNYFILSNDYGIKCIDLLGNGGGFVPTAKIKNIIIYNNNNNNNNNNKKHYLDTTGLTSLWSKIKSLFATKTELASKANTSDLSTVATSGSYNDLLDKPASFDVDVLKSWPDGSAAHNAMWGGRDITDAFNNGTVSANIKNGTFKDIFPGDYITKQVTIPQVLADDGTTVLYRGDTYTIDWVIADCDYWSNAARHVVIVPRRHIFYARMNPTNTTEGGYAGSEMFKKIIPACATGIVNAFGSDHILTFKDAITNSVDTSHASSGTPQFMGTPGWFGEWVSVQCNLMSEKMVYGAPIFSAGAMDNIMATRQMSAFRLSSLLINDGVMGRVWWLRDVVSSSHFAAVYSYPFVGVYADAWAAADIDRAMLEHPGVRPFALLC